MDGMGIVGAIFLRMDVEFENSHLPIRWQPPFDKIFKARHNDIKEPIIWEFWIDQNSQGGGLIGESSPKWLKYILFWIDIIRYWR